MTYDSKTTKYKNFWLKKVTSSGADIHKTCSPDPNTSNSDYLLPPMAIDTPDLAALHEMMIQNGVALQPVHFLLDPQNYFVRSPEGYKVYEFSPDKLDTYKLGVLFNGTDYQTIDKDLIYTYVCALSTSSAIANRHDATIFREYQHLLSDSFPTFLRRIEALEQHFSLEPNQLLTPAFELRSTPLRTILRLNRFECSNHGP